MKRLSLGLVDLLAGSFFVKLLLFPAYRSTDFEVHRNWLAITSSLPVTKWYFDDTSEWTLDYPPFFAFFEYTLAQFARYVDPAIISLSNLDYNEWSVVAFQRGSVLVTELLLFFALLRYFAGDREKQINAILLVFLSPGILIVDHVHFQYNGFLLGILVLSLAEARRGNHVRCALWFAVLLNFKHIFIYLAPAFFIFLLRTFCLDTKLRLSLSRFISLGSIVIATCSASFGYFAMHEGQLAQILSRLFPFKRGLVHAYWAANVWALYAFTDVVLARMFHLGPGSFISATRGIVGDTKFALFPDISPPTSMFITLLSHLPPLLELWKAPTHIEFVKSVAMCAFGSFLFGWHVHEKAILLILVPLALLAIEKKDYAQSFFSLQLAGHFGLFPLLFGLQETLPKICALTLYTVMIFKIFPYIFKAKYYSSKSRHAKLSILERAYAWGIVLVELSAGTLVLIVMSYGDTSSSSGWGKYTFLPNMVTSVYCAFGVLGVWLQLLWQK